MAWALSTQDPEALAESARPFIGDVRIHRRRDGPFRGTVDAVALSRMTLCRVRLRNAALSSRRRDSLGAWMPLRGPITLATPPDTLDVAPGRIAVTPGERTVSFEAESTDLLVAAFSNDFVDTVANTMDGSIDDLRLGGTLPADTAWNASLRRYLQFVWSEVSQTTPSILTSDLVLRACEEALLVSLYLASRDVSLTTSYADPRPDYLVRAVEHIDGNLTEAPRVADLSRIAGVSASTLSRAFRWHHGCGPMSFAKRQRLDRARQDLMLADPQDATVTDIATRHGFYHLAQFAADFRKAFGEKPSETLRRV